MKRLALYFAPPPGPLARTAAHWLGRDAVSGAQIDPPHPLLSALATSARRYGFHATLKAPFRLAEGLTEPDLIDALHRFAARHRPVQVEALRVASLDGFLALVPEGDTAALDSLAAQVVTAFDLFRAPMTDAERARRQPDRLSIRQRALLDAYGYPFVLDEFRFHMTLTDRLDATQHAELVPLAQALFDPVLPRPFGIDRIAVFGESEDGVFHQRASVPLG